jgi:hypothetical protein
MTELPKEWLQEAERIANTNFDCSNSALKGAKAYKKAVENMIDGELSKCALANLMLTDNAGREVNKLIISRIEKIKEQLQTLKPTSNDNNTQGM